FNKNGVNTMPIMLEAEALQTAAETLPLAMDVNAMADCTVPGSTHKYSTPTYRGPPSKGSSTGFKPQPSRGNIIKVQAKTSRCSRQCVAPATIALRDSLAP